MNGCKLIEHPDSPWLSYWCCTLDTSEKQLECAHFTKGASPMCAHNPPDSDYCESRTAQGRTTRRVVCWKCGRNMMPVRSKVIPEHRACRWCDADLDDVAHLVEREP